jgi:transcriptional regulator with XRE-family HTH domain
MSQKIKSKMILKKISQAQIAEELGIDRSTVSGVVNGYRKSRRIQKAIADALGESYEKLWGKAA